MDGMVGVRFAPEWQLSQGGEGMERHDYPAPPRRHQVAARGFAQAHDTEQLCSRSCSSINAAWRREVSRGLRERPANFRNQCLRGGQGNEGHARGACVLAAQHPREASISRGLARAMFIHLFTPSRYDE